MSEDVDRSLGQRVRLERETRGWSLSDLAERSGVSRAMIHRIETATSSPTASLLGRLAGAFGISMSTLIARAELQQGRLSRQGDQHVWTDPVTGYLRRHVSPRTAAGIDLVEVDFPPGREVSFPAASYRDCGHLVWVLEGDLVLIQGAQRHQLARGDCLELGPPEDCTFRNESAQPCRYVVIVQRAAR